MKNFLLVILAMAAPFAARSENWAHWRGPLFNGATTETKAPSDFSKSMNVKWTAPLPGASAATPIIWDNCVLVSSGDEQQKSLRALCFDRKSGKILWNHEISTAYNQDDKSNFASPSPVTNGKVAVFLYGNGELAAFDLTGKKLWNRNLQKDYGEFAYQWTYGASPTIYEGQLIIQVLQRDEPVQRRGQPDGSIDSYLLALEPSTGKQLWKHVRPSEAHGESHEAYSTPIPFTYQNRTELLVAGGDCLSGHSTKDGSEFWRWGSWNPGRISHWRLVPSPVTGGGVVLACAPKNGAVYACKAGATGNQDDSVLAWKSSDKAISSDVATPLFYKGRFYVLNGEHHSISRLAPASGKVEWTGELEVRAKIEGSPTAAGDKIYFQNFHGDVFVVAAAESFKLLKTVPMGDEGDDQIRASIPISNGELFIRTTKKLYCVGEPSKPALK
jgi:outer membrane protein assembly factor BamB